MSRIQLQIIPLNISFLNLLFSSLQLTWDLSATTPIIYYRCRSTACLSQIKLGIHRNVRVPGFISFLNRYYTFSTGFIHSDYSSFSSSLRLCMRANAIAAMMAASNTVPIPIAAIGLIPALGVSSSGRLPVPPSSPGLSAIGA